MKKITFVFMFAITFLAAREYTVIDNLIDESKYDEALSKALKLQEKNADDSDIYWQVGRCYFELLDQSDDDSIKKEYATKGIEFVKKSIRMNKISSQAHHWYAVLLGQIGVLEGTKQMIEKSYDVRKHALIAIKLDPNYDGTLHVMGRWHYKLAGLSKAERLIASIIYSKPPQATFKESADFFQKAINAKPDEIRHWLWHGKALIETGDIEEARKSLSAAVELIAYDNSGELLKKEAKDLLEDLK